MSKHPVKVVFIIGKRESAVLQLPLLASVGRKEGGVNECKRQVGFYLALAFLGYGLFHYLGLGTHFKPQGGLQVINQAVMAPILMSGFMLTNLHTFSAKTCPKMNLVNWSQIVTGLKR